MGIGTSTLIAYATSSIVYSWDVIRGLLYDAGGLNLFVVIVIITGIIGLVIKLIRSVIK